MAKHKRDKTGGWIQTNDPAKEYFFKEGCHILEMLNDSADSEASIARARVEPGIQTKLHALSGTTERYVILQGQGRVILGPQEERTEQVVTVGDVVVIPADVPQAIRNEGRNDLIFLAICSPRFTPECYREVD